MMTKYFTIYMCFISHGFSFCNWVTNFFLNFIPYSTGRDLYKIDSPYSFF